MTTNISASEQLTYCTVRIQAEYGNTEVGTGTGYFYSFAEEERRSIPAIVTNKHVVEGATSGSFQLHVSDGKGRPNGQFVNVRLDDFSSQWVHHPDKDIDLCAMPIASLLGVARGQGKDPFFATNNRSMVLSDQELSDLNALEDIVMVGYPLGIWDATNNQPIIRRGITATHPGVNYEGRSEFVIDAACYPGSSGSPVFLFNTGSYASKTGNIVMGTRVKLLGTLYAGPQFTAQGEVKVVTVPTSQQLVSESKIPLNLGFVIKASRLFVFDSILRKLAQTSGDA